jgi:hypothetical protein
MAVSIPLKAILKIITTDETNGIIDSDTEVKVTIMVIIRNTTKANNAEIAMLLKYINRDIFS